ncbi:EAL domain-containing protein [Vibrio sp. SBT000027]|jgi:EAL domain-containing protein (putative c-di-GMP-specific phosphodiesterase class I)|uniref:EAL domain-containing protein n=1 Tax=Vibrio sp. SBT000027 TaxID=1803384 RepID=UPI000EF43C04|nr:EAL domain-containing protein [Vibrio sp. SBT000027]RLQ17083.1 EAL domain-containing protein [Vibrio sp. SBT000027]
MCRFIFELSEKIISHSVVNVDYKIQEINCFSSYEPVGYEVLINSSKLSESERKLVFSNDVKHPNSVRRMMKRVINTIINKKDTKEKLSNKSLFINLERSNLCDYYLLSELKKASNVLKKNSINLVIEITERDTCPQCKRVSDGLKLLNIMDIPLAIDDFDIYSGDYRNEEFKQGIYSYIKIRTPKNEEEENKLALFRFQNPSEKIIIENVENQSDIDFLKNIKPTAVQGFFFDTECELS